MGWAGIGKPEGKETYAHKNGVRLGCVVPGRGAEHGPHGGRAGRRHRAGEANGQTGSALHGDHTEEDIMIRCVNRIYLMRIVSSLGLAVLLVACAAQYKEQEQALQGPVRINCATAEGDIRTLQHEKSHVAQQIAMGVTAIAPAGIVMGVLAGTEQTKLEVATGDYNRMIDQRIADIKMTCGVP
jgi:hypothetical protein